MYEELRGLAEEAKAAGLAVVVLCRLRRSSMSNKRENAKWGSTWWPTPGTPQRSSARWQDLPEVFASSTTCWQRLRQSEE